MINSTSKPFRESFFDELCKLEAAEILSLESIPCPYDVKNLTQRYENLRFIIFSEESNMGARIDTAFRETLCRHCLVVSGEAQISALRVTAPVLTEILERGQLCTVPVFQNKDEETLPTAIGPMPGSKKRFQVLPTAPGREETPTLLPWTYSGIYRKDKHTALGGFDHSIQESWWQLLEYGMRAWLWGEKLSTHPDFKVKLLEDSPPVDTTPGPGYRRFYLRTLAVQRRGDMGRLTRLQWWSYLRDSGDKSHKADRDWREISRWVQENRSRYILDAAELAEIWPWADR